MTKTVNEIGRAFIAVTNLDESVKQWAKLGFDFDSIDDQQDHRACGFHLQGGGVLLVQPKPGSTAETQPGLADAAQRRLDSTGPGLFGWSWVSDEFEASALALGLTIEGKQIVLRPDQSPGAFTVLEPSDPSRSVQHPNGIGRSDHVVLFTGDAESVGQRYQQVFGLRPRFQKARSRSYAFLKVGPSLLEVVGPEQPDDNADQFLWGVAMRSPDLDATFQWMNSHNVACKEPREAVQGGRILNLSEPLNGVALAVMGD